MGSNFKVDLKLENGISKWRSNVGISNPSGIEVTRGH